MELDVRFFAITVGLPAKVCQLLQARYGSIPEGLGGQAWMPDPSHDALANEMPATISRILMRYNIELSCAAESATRSEPQRPGLTRIRDAL